jgi:hypothetical protein
MEYIYFPNAFVFQDFPCRYKSRKRPLGRPRHRWEINIAMDLEEIGWEGVDWIHLAQDRDR